MWGSLRNRPVSGVSTFLYEPMVKTTLGHWRGGGFKYFLFHPYLGKISNLMGWNHQSADIFWRDGVWSSMVLPSVKLRQHPKMGLPKRKLVFQPSSGAMLFARGVSLLVGLFQLKRTWYLTVVSRVYLGYQGLSSWLGFTQYTVGYIDEEVFTAAGLHP